MTLEHRLVEACDELEKCKRYYRELDDYFKVIKAERDALARAVCDYIDQLPDGEHRGLGDLRAALKCAWFPLSCNVGLNGLCEC